jgi:hypothetical protein
MRDNHYAIVVTEPHCVRPLRYKCTFPERPGIRMLKSWGVVYSPKRGDTYHITRITKELYEALEGFQWVRPYTRARCNVNL